MFKEDFLKESHKVDPYIDISQTVSYFNDVFESIAKPSLVALLGDHGCGKSTMLYQLKRKTSNEIDWFFFDAWKYPRRADLWEGFITEIAVEFGLEQEAVNRIKGKSKSSEATNILSKMLEATQDLTSIPGLKVVGQLTSKLFEKDPITKLEGFQELLRQILLDRKKSIYITIEDIDRSKDQGVFFIETLRFFLNETDLENKDIAVIVPMSKENYDLEKSSYLKCFDFVDSFTLKNINFDSFVKNGLREADTLITPLRNEKLTFDLISKQISSFLGSLVRTFPYLTVREIKLILRNANKQHLILQLSGLTPDYRVSLCIEAMKLIPKSRANNQSHWEHSAVQQNIIESHSKVFARFLTLILTRVESIDALMRLNRNIYEFQIVKEDSSIVPLWQIPQPQGTKGYLQQNYFH